MSADESILKVVQDRIASASSSRSRSNTEDVHIQRQESLEVEQESTFQDRMAPASRSNTGNVPSQTQGNLGVERESKPAPAKVEFFQGASGLEKRVRKGKNLPGTEQDNSHSNSSEAVAIGITTPSEPGAYACSPSGVDHQDHQSEADEHEEQVQDMEVPLTTTTAISQNSEHASNHSIGNVLSSHSSHTLRGYIVSNSDDSEEADDVASFVVPTPMTEDRSGALEQCEEGTNQPYGLASASSSPTRSVSFDCPDEVPLVVMGTADKGDNTQKYQLLFFIAGVSVLLLVIIFMSLGLLGVFESTEEDVPMISASSSATLLAIKERGILKCASLDPFGQALCEALAAAILGGYPMVQNCDPSFSSLADGECDVLAHGATHNMERQVYQSQAQAGFSFSTPFLYDTVKVAGDPYFVECADDNLRHVGNCSDLQVCVWEDTTHEEIVRKRLPERYMTLVPTMDGLYQGLAEGSCNVIVLEGFVLGEHYIRDAGYEGPYAIGRSSYAKEPLAFVTRGDDDEFSDFVEAVLQALIAAEMHHITQDTADRFPTTELFPGIGDVNMFRRAIQINGNFGQIWAKYMERDLPRESLNLINDGSTGLLFAHPFGPIMGASRENTDLSAALKSILDRGILHCGIVIDREGFAMKTSDKGYSGMDVDYCRALSASLFQGSTEKVEFIELEDAETGFASLARGHTDVFAGATWNLKTDVHEPTTGMGFSFTQPYFYGVGNDDKILALATMQGDHDWSSFVYWVLEATIYAEEHSIDKLGSNKMPEVSVFGPSFNRMLRDPILGVGNYGEMYSHNLEAVVPRSGPNQLNDISNPKPQHRPPTGFGMIAYSI